MSRRKIFLLYPPNHAHAQTNRDNIFTLQYSSKYPKLINGILSNILFSVDHYPLGYAPHEITLLFKITNIKSDTHVRNNNDVKHPCLEMI